MKTIKLFFLIVFACFLLLATYQYSKKNDMPYFILNHTKIYLEIAATKEQREQGLMYRQSMPKNLGMIFLFNKPQYLSFWMKNTLIALDMVFLNNYQVVAIIKNISPCPKETILCPTYNPNVLADAVIEINAGMVEKLNINVNDKINLFNSHVG